MGQDDQLQRYREMRDLDRSPEPSGMSRRTGSPRFVIQKHDARTLHYDFRIEYNSVLASWAVPKGPSMDPGVKRLAIHVEDHPLDYADFEGTIPEGAYGAGTVIVWDAGTYRNLMGEKDDPLSVEEAIEVGHVEVWLEGQKLRGGYALRRIDDEKDQWLLVKMKDEHADADTDPLTSQPESVVSGRTLEEVAEAATSEGA